VLLDRSLRLREEERRAASSRVRQLVPREFREGKLVAAIRLEAPGRGETLLYGRSKETWRCLSRFGAPADEGKIQSLLEKLFTTQGIVQTRNEIGYGFGSDSVLILSLHGPQVFKQPKGDLLFAFEIGMAILGAEGCYVRKAGQKEVVAVTANLREELEWRGGKDLPPLVDPHIVPAAFAPRGGPRRIEVHRADGEGYELLRRDRKVEPEELKAGRLPWDWVLALDGKEVELPPGPVNSYTGFLLRATFAAVLDPKTASERGLDNPAAKLTLHGAEGDPATLEVGKQGAGGGWPVRNAPAQSLVEVTGETAALLAPRAADLQTADKNPWEELLKSEK
jgi:hypothetical protein